MSACLMASVSSGAIDRASASIEGMHKRPRFLCANHRKRWTSSPTMLSTFGFFGIALLVGAVPLAIKSNHRVRLYHRAKEFIRTEMFTLVGLMARANPDYDALPPEDPAGVAAQAEALLEELPQSMTMPWSEAFGEAMANGELRIPWTSADAMREPIFYGGEAAFSVQNCDFAGEKYGKP